MILDVKRFADNTYQIWRGKEVLRPRTLEWENSEAGKFDFMYLNSMAEVNDILDALREKHKAKKLIETTKVNI